MMNYRIFRINSIDLRTLKSIKISSLRDWGGTSIKQTNPNFYPNKDSQEQTRALCNLWAVVIRILVCPASIFWTVLMFN